MNFRLTLWKTVVSILIIILGPTILGSISIKKFYIVDPLMKEMWGFYLMLIVVAIIVYIIWSIFQKSGRRK